MNYLLNATVPIPFLPEPGIPKLQWKQWLRTFNSYLLAIDGLEFAPIRKVAILYNCLGSEGQRIFDHLPTISSSGDQQWDAFTEAVQRLQKHFQGDLSIIVERHKFFTRRQLQEESIDTFVAELRILAATCEFDGPLEKYLRDQIAVNCWDKRIQEKILCSRNPTLQETLEIARGIERSVMASKELLKNTAIENVQAVHSVHKPTSSAYAKRNDKTTTNTNCYRCGSRNHLANSRDCPATGKMCAKCKKKVILRRFAKAQ